MIIGGILTAIGHTVAFMLKTSYIAIRRFTMDPANKNTLWNIQALSTLMIVILSFLWLVGKYQDIFYGLGEPVFFRAIPLLLACFLGHLIYSCPIFFRNTYAKPIIQTFLNSLSIMAAGQILLRYVPGVKGLIIDSILFVVVNSLTLYYTLQLNIRSTIFNKLTRNVEQAELSAERTTENKYNEMFGGKGSKSTEFTKIDLNQRGCISHLRYYNEECKLELFNTVPTQKRQSELMVLSRSDRAQHSQIIGGTGAGKTLLATNLIAQDLLNDFIGSTIIEPKGSLIHRLSNFMDRTGRQYRRLDPEYEFSDCLNPFYVPTGQDIEPMIEANVSAFHGYLGPDAVQYFKSRSTQLMRVGIKALKLVKENDCTYNDLDRLIQPINDDYRAEILSELIGRESEVPLLLQYTRDMASGGKTQEHAMQTYSNLYDYLTELTSNKYIQRIFCGPSTFNIDDTLRNGEVVLVNGAYGTLQTLTYTVGRLYINLLRASTFRRNLKEKVRPHQLTVDEVEMFADEEFSTFLEMAREFEVFVTLIHQGNVQLSDVSKRLAGMVKQNAVQKFILAGLDIEDAEYYADMIGEDYQIGKRSGTDEMSTTGFNTQISEDLRYTVLPSDIARLKGYNPESGEAGECLFRGVHNNVRLEPVIGMIYPLPRKLFVPLSIEETNDKTECHNEDEDSIDEQNGIEEETESKELLHASKLDRIKRKAKDTEQRQQASEVKTPSSNSVRNLTWDAGDEEGPFLETKDSLDNQQIEEDKASSHQAEINERLNELEQYLAEKAQNGRNQRKNEVGE